MLSSKIFAGSKLRRQRQKLGLSQAALAQSLGLSASYLNLMERDQRPLTAQVVLKLSQMPGFDIAALAATEAEHALLTPIRNILSDPLHLGDVPPGNEVSEALSVAPNVMGAMVKLYAAYRDLQKRLGDAARGLPPQPREVTLFEWTSTYNFNAIEALAEDIHAELVPKDDIFSGLKARLRSSHGIDTRLVPALILGQDRARYDRHSQRLFISEMQSQASRAFEAALLLARLESRELLERLTPLQKWAILARLAVAILSPRGKFTVAAEDLKLDLTTLSQRFCLSPSHVILRLASLNSASAALQIDHAGRLINLIGKLPFHLARDEPLCAQLPVFGQSHHMEVRQYETASNKTCVVLAINHTALFMSKQNFDKTIYAHNAKQRPLGATCRLCDVKDCNLRGAFSATRPAGMNDYIRSATDFE